MPVATCSTWACDLAVPGELIDWRRDAALGSCELAKSVCPVRTDGLVSITYWREVFGSGFGA